jgi:hypothetical protein
MPVDETSPSPIGDNSSLGMACNAYRRLHGAWPETVRFAPGHFASYVETPDTEQIELLASIFEVVVSAQERSARLTVFGPNGGVTYERGVEEGKWDLGPFKAR